MKWANVYGKEGRASDDADWRVKRWMRSRSNVQYGL